MSKIKSSISERPHFIKFPFTDILDDVDLFSGFKKIE